MHEATLFHILTTTSIHFTKHLKCKRFYCPHAVIRSILLSRLSYNRFTMMRVDPKYWPPLPLFCSNISEYLLNDDAQSIRDIVNNMEHVERKFKTWWSTRRERSDDKNIESCFVAIRGFRSTRVWVSSRWISIFFFYSQTSPMQISRKKKWKGVWCQQGNGIDKIWKNRHTNITNTHDRFHIWCTRNYQLL